MTKPLSEFRTFLEFALKAFAILPVFAVIFGFSYEIPYFITIGSSVSYFFGLNDILRSALFFLVPSIPMMIIGVIFGITLIQADKEAEPDPVKQRSKRAVHLWVFRLIMLLCALYYFLIGGSFILLLVALTIFLASVVPHIVFWFIEPLDLSPKLLLPPYFLYIAMVAFGANGSSHAYLDRRANFATRPDVVILEQVQAHKLIRKLDSGAVVFSVSEQEILYVEASKIKKISDKASEGQWQGLLCSVFDKCL